MRTYVIQALICAVLLTPLSAAAEVIRSFTSDIEISSDGVFTVTERIVYDFEDAERHGIYRVIPTSHPDDATAWYKRRFVDIDLLSVRMDGAEVPYADESGRGEFKIRIGDPDRTVSGTHTYELSYAVAGGLSYGDLTELYWNVTGSDWDVPMQAVEARVTAPDDAFAGEAACYEGEPGSATQCIAEREGNAYAFIASDLAPGEEMTIAAALDPESVAYLVREEMRTLWFAIALGVLLLIGTAYTAYRLRTVYRIDAPIIAQYEPYERARPMYAGMLIDGTLDARDVTAGIVHLAEQGFLKIRHIDTKFLFFDMSDYEIELLKDGATAPGPFLKDVLSLIFDDVSAVGSRVTLSEIKKNLPKQQLNQTTVQRLRKDLRTELETSGFFERTFSFAGPKRTLIAGAAIAPVLGVASLIAGPAMLVLSVAYAVVLVIAASIVWHRRTRKGYEAANHLRGFKEFLSVTDAERFAFHNAPQKSPELFMAYLPYAIAFGVEREWAKAFRDLTIPNPTWYDGGRAGNFSAAAFARDMGTFSNSLSSSGSSASSGGGSAGGGAGGGGGGSW